MRPLLLALALVFVCSRSASAAWSTDPSANLAVSTSTGNQTDAVVCSDGAGGFIVAWVDARTGANDVYAQRVSATGSKLWTSTGVAICTATGEQTKPVIITDNAGGAIIAWVDGRNLGVTSTDLYAQRVNSSGVVQWTANGAIVCDVAGGQSDLVMITDKPNNAILAWRDDRSPNGGIYLQRVNGSGTSLLTADGVLVCNAAGIQQFPRLISDGTGGGSIVAWEDQRNGSYDVYAQRMSSGGTPQWTANGIGVVTASQDQFDIALVSDVAGGALIAWADFRSGDLDIYAQHLTSAGDILWGDNGVGMLVSSVSGSQADCMAVTDGSGGMILGWRDYRNGSSLGDAYVQRITPGGQLLWASNGTNLSTNAADGYLQSLDSDGSGGAIAVWGDLRTGPGAGSDLYAQRVNGAGTALWGSGGAAVSIAGGSQTPAVVLCDGAEGAFAVWTDARQGPSNLDVYAQRIERFGKLGDPAPAIVSVKDVPNDQGGSVRVLWNASPLDNVPSNAISTYFVFRQVPAFAAQAASRAGRFVRTQPSAAGVVYWEFLTSVSANGFPGYSIVAPTTGDSVGGSNPRTYFMVEARQSNGYYWDSPADSGYSVDNLPPGSIAPLLGAYRATDTRLHWQPVSAPDLAGYVVHRGSSASFVPGPSSYVGSTPDTGYVDPVGVPYFYKVAAIDAHGNLGPFSLVQPSGTLAVEPGLAIVSLARPTPNPARADVALRFTLPARDAARVSVHDAQGRLVRTLVDGEQSLGEHTVSWDRADAHARRASAGLYFVRLETRGRVLTQRLVLLD